MLASLKGPFSKEENKINVLICSTTFVLVLLSPLTLIIFNLYDNMLHFMQDPETYFYVLKVDEDNVQMSDFVKRALGVTKFENGRGYYEFTQMEMEDNFLFYKEVVRMNKVIL